MKGAVRRTNSTGNVNRSAAVGLPGVQGSPVPRTAAGGRSSPQLAVAGPLGVQGTTVPRTAAGGRGPIRCASAAPAEAATTTVTDPPRIVYLCASPIALTDGSAAPTLDLQAEFDRIVEAARSASCAVQLSFAHGTAQQLTDELSTGCAALHYSGHGMTSATGESVLAFEDGRGGCTPMGEEQLKSLLQQCPAMRLAFVSACSAEDIGKTFVAAGVPHVVVTKRTARLQDKAAAAFAANFYGALLRGRTVAQAFGIGKHSVAHTASGVVQPAAEAAKFLLLPADQPHNEVIFATSLASGGHGGAKRKVVVHRARSGGGNLPAFLPWQLAGRRKDWAAGVRTLADGRKRVLTIVGPAGVGKTALAIAAATYAVDRGHFPAGAHFINFSRLQGNEAESQLLQIEQLMEAAAGEEGRGLLLLDGCDSLEHEDGLLQQLIDRVLQQTRISMILTANRDVAGISGVPQEVLSLTGLQPKDACKLLLSLAPRAVAHSELFGPDPGARLLKIINEKVAPHTKFELHKGRRVVATRVVPREAAQELVELLRADEGPGGSVLDVWTETVKEGRSRVVATLSPMQLLMNHPLMAALDGMPRRIGYSAALLSDSDGGPCSLELVWDAVRYAGVAPSSVCEAFAGRKRDILDALRQETAAAPPTDEPELHEPATAIEHDSLQLGSWIGAGTFGALYEGVYKGQKVAIRKFFESNSRSQVFAREVKLLASIRHPHVVRLLAADKTSMQLITEFASGGSLKQALKREGGMGAAEKVGVVTQVCCAMEHLHSLSPQVMHRNLKTTNILLCEGAVAKLSDFGWAHFRESESARTFFTNWQWVPPEMLNNEPFCCASDVFAFGMVAYEVFGNCAPFNGLNAIQIGMAIARGSRPELVDSIPTALATTVIVPCWSQEPEARPSFNELAQTLASGIDLV